MGLGVGNAVAPGVGLALATGVAVGLALGLGLSVLVGVAVGPALGVAEGVVTGVGLALGDAPGVLLSEPDEQPTSPSKAAASIRLRVPQPRLNVFATVYRASRVSQCIARPRHQPAAIVTALVF